MSEVLGTGDINVAAWINGLTDDVAIKLILQALTGGTPPNPSGSGGLPVSGQQRTPTLSATQAAGSVAAGAQSVGFVTSPDWVGTILGASFPASSAVSYSANPGDTLGAFSFTRSAGTLYVAAVR